MFDLRNRLPMLYDFYIVAKEKSFSLAAAHNYVSQSNLSRSIKNLEESLNLLLINRSNKGITLTLDGEKLYKELDIVFNSIYQYNLNKADEKEITGMVTIGSTRNIADNILIKYLSIFNKKYPKIKIKIITDSAKNLNDYLLNHKIDLLIDYLPNINFSEKLDIKVVAISQFKTCFACSKEFYQTHGKNIKYLKDLDQYDLVIPGSSRRRQLLDEKLQEENIQLHPNIEMPDSLLMIQLVENSNYIGYFIEDEIKNTSLCKLNFNIEMPINSIGLIYSEKIINNIAQKFVEIVLDNS